MNKTGAVKILYYRFWYVTDISALNISAYRHQSDISTLRMTHTVITSFVVLIVRKASSSDFPQGKNNSQQQWCRVNHSHLFYKCEAEWTDFYQSDHIGDFTIKSYICFLADIRLILDINIGLAQPYTKHLPKGKEKLISHMILRLLGLSNKLK